MMKRLIALTSFGAGYVAGAAAGRERYEQIRGLALRVKDDPRVQEKAHQAADLAQQGAHEAADVLKHETEPLKDAVKDKLPGQDSGADPTFHATTRF